MTATVTCPRCKQSFQCNKQAIQQCFCASLPITTELREQLSRRYQGCLCEQCLTQLILETKD